MIHLTLDAHETIVEKSRIGIDKTEESGDWGSNDLLMSDVLRRNEMQVWFIAEHVVEAPLLEAGSLAAGFGARAGPRSRRPDPSRPAGSRGPPSGTCRSARRSR